MGLFDSLLGRSKQAQPNLDALFSLPSAVLTLEAAADIRPTGSGAVCFRESEGAPFARVKAEIATLLGGAEPQVLADLHDRQRVTRRGRGTHGRVMEGIARLRRHGIPFHVITVLTRETLDYPDEDEDSRP